MKIVITGGTGLIGKALSCLLLDGGHDVVVLSRDAGAGRRVVDGRAAVVEWDGQTAKGWAKHADGADAIVNLAGANIGSGRWTPAFRKLIVGSRLNASRAVVEAVREAKVKPRTVIQASGIGAYGNVPDGAVDESTPLGTGFLPDVVRVWESAVDEVRGMGVRVAAVRTGVVLDAKEGALPRLALPFRLFAGGTIGSGRNWFPWIHVADEARAIAFLIERTDLSGPFNLVGPELVRAREFNRLLGRAMKRPHWMPVPAFAVRMLLGEMAEELILSGVPARPRRLLDAGFEFRFRTARDALADLFG